MSEGLTRRTLLINSAVAAGAVMLGAMPAEAARKRRVVVWAENTAPKNVYPNDVNAAIAEGLKPLKGWEIVVASINDPEQGCTQESLDKTDVLIWWGHIRHGDVKDEYVDRIVKRVKEGGMGFIPTHSAHWSKPFQKLMERQCGWGGGYVEDNSSVKVIVKDSKHPIAKGIKDFVIPHTERYTEPFDVPAPEALVFDGVYTLPNGSTEPSRQGLVWTVGKGKVFYFQPGHETNPIYYQDEVKKIFINAVQWAAPKR